MGNVVHYFKTLSQTCERCGKDVEGDTCAVPGCGGRALVKVQPVRSVRYTDQELIARGWPVGLQS
jgi:hypothetical protein